MMATTKLAPPNLEAAELHALAIAGKFAKPARSKLKHGTHKIDFVARFAGLVKVLKDTTSSETSTPDAPAIIGHLLAKLPEASRDEVLDHLHELYRRGRGKLPKVEQAIADRVSAMLARMRKVRTIPKKGAVSGEIEVTILPEATRICREIGEQKKRLAS